MSRAEAGTPRKADELRREITNALTSPDAQWFTNMVERPSTTESRKALPGIELHDELRIFSSAAEPSSPPQSFLQKLINVIEETATASAIS